ncbi:unnamed protein product [Amaranthus hypochondriacus]
MAMSKVVMFLVMIVSVWVACHGDCSLDKNMMSNLNKCKAAVTLSNPTDPTAACCTMVQNLKPSDIACLCEYKVKDAALLYFAGVDPDRCTQLPKLCNLNIPVNC